MFFHPSVVSWSVSYKARAVRYFTYDVRWKRGWQHAFAMLDKMHMPQWLSFCVSFWVIGRLQGYRIAYCVLYCTTSIHNCKHQGKDDGANQDSFLIGCCLFRRFCSKKRIRNGLSRSLDRKRSTCYWLIWIQDRVKYSLSIEVVNNETHFVSN